MPGESASPVPWQGDDVADATGQRHTLERELESLHGASFAWALTCCGGRTEEAEDVLQTVYLKILEGKARWRGASSWKTWLFAVIRRTASDRRRRSAWRSLLLDRWRGESEPAPALASPEVQARRSERGVQILRALASLSPKQRGVLELVAYHDLTVREAAEVLGLRLGTARTHYQRGKQALRRGLAREELLDD